MKASIHGKSICKQLKAVRQRIAEENDIPLEQRECTYEGSCRGTCPRCEAEVQYLERALASRLKLGRAATVAGLSLSLAACGNGQGGPLVEADSLSDGEVFEEVGPEDTLTPPPPPLPPDYALPELEGIVALGDPNYPEEFAAPKDSQKDDFYDGYYTEPAVKAEFPGGQKALERWLDRHVQTPSQFEVDGIVGEVVAALRIESDGHVSGYRIIKGLEGCNNEARRVINTMPRWKPAGIPGKGPVASIVTVSIPFMALAVVGDVVEGEMPEDD
ncbi:MAG: energy transducer TonB [Bacteroidales bacterium]|nr:energy transducer TonB [Bacteroidales bacterium]